MTGATTLPRRAVAVAAVSAAVVTGLSTAGAATPLTVVGEVRAGATVREASPWSPALMSDERVDQTDQHALQLTSTVLTTEVVDLGPAAAGSPAARSVASHDGAAVSAHLPGDAVRGRGAEGPTSGRHGGPASTGHRALALALGALTLVTLGAALRVRSRALGECRRLVGS